MTAGRPRKPDAVHHLQGTYRQDRHGDPERKPVPSEASPTMPSHIKGDEFAERAWKMIVKEHRQMKILSRTYQLLMELFCNAYARYRSAEAEVENIGIIIREKVLDKDNKLVLDPQTKQPIIRIKRNPAAIESRALLDALKQLLPELGLTPVALSKLTLPDEPKQDPVDEFLDGDEDAIAGKVY